jgi:hypothetical protein
MNVPTFVPVFGCEVLVEARAKLGGAVVMAVNNINLAGDIKA